MGDAMPTARSWAASRHRPGAEIRSGAGEGSWLWCPLAVPGSGPWELGGGAGRGRPAVGSRGTPPASPGVILLNKRLFFIIKLEVLAAPRCLPLPRGGCLQQQLLSLPA